MSVGASGRGILLDDAPGKRDRALSFQQRDWLAQQIREFLHDIEYERSA